jgi:2-phospho-L-lactate guanylyltransferase
LLDPAELENLLRRRLDTPGALIVPDRHGTGTNALLLQPPQAIPPAFGPGSCARHMRLALDNQVNVELVEVTSLGLDVDTPDDLATVTAQQC